MLAIIPLLLIASIGPDADSGQIQGEPQAVRDLRIYRSLLIQYRDGDDAVVDEILKWDDDRLDAAIGLIDSRMDPTKPWVAALFKTAAAMHTAAALRCLDRRMSLTALWHLEVALGHIRRGRQDLAPFGSRWFLAMSRRLQADGSHPEAERFHEAARSVLPNDPIVFYESGVLQELFATKWDPVSARPPDGRIGVRHDPMPGMRRRRSERMEQAERWLRRSLELVPTNSIAKLHLGRALMMRGESRQAAEQFHVVAATTDGALAYLAGIFLAALHDRDGHLDAAESAYRGAIKAFDRGQSAYVGLSEVLLRLKRPEEARAVLRQLLTDAPATRREPWLWYFREPDGVVRERIDALLKEGRR
jgi:tetratricopeptide (TPR) repeat protein